MRSISSLTPLVSWISRIVVPLGPKIAGMAAAVSSSVLSPARCASAAVRISRIAVLAACTLSSDACTYSSIQGLLLYNNDTEIKMKDYVLYNSHYCCYDYLL